MGIGSVQAFPAKPFQIYLIDTSNDAITNSFKSIIQDNIAVHQSLTLNSSVLSSISEDIGPDSLLILVGHGSEEGLSVNEGRVPWKEVGITLNEISPFKVFLASCHASGLQDHYLGDLVCLPYNADAEITAWWILYHLLRTTYNLEGSVSGDFLKDREFILEKASQRNQEILEDLTKFKPLDALDVIYNYLDSDLASDSDGYPIDYWVYDNTAYTGFNENGDRVGFGEEGNEGNNALNVIFYGLRSVEIPHLLFATLGWSSFGSALIDINYLHGTSGPIEYTNNYGAIFWDTYPQSGLYYQHMRIWDLYHYPDFLQVGQCHKTLIAPHKWGFYEETENHILNSVDGYFYDSLDPAYPEDFYVHGSETYPQTSRHIGSTNSPDDWDYPLDYQDGMCVLISRHIFSDFENGNTYAWAVYWPMTQASHPRFDVVTYVGPSPYPSGTKRGRLYMQDSSGDKAVIYKWLAVEDNLLRTSHAPNHKYYSYYTERSNDYMLAYHDFYPVLQDSNNYIRVRFYGKYFSVYRMRNGALSKLYEENVYDHTGWWGYDWQQVEVDIWNTYNSYYRDFSIRMKVARKAEGQVYTSGVITLYGHLPENYLFMEGPIAIGFRGGWSSGNYGYAYWDIIRVGNLGVLL